MAEVIEKLETGQLNGQVHCIKLILSMFHQDTVSPKSLSAGGF